MRTHAARSSAESSSTDAPVAAPREAPRPAGAPTQAGHGVSGEDGAGLGRTAFDFSRLPIVSDSPPPVQPRLAVSPPGDVYEQEAERAAEQVRDDAEPASPSGLAPAPPPPPPDGPGSGPARLQASRHPGAPARGRDAPPIVHQVLATPGVGLDTATRRLMERRLGHDFSRVRVHADAPAARSARAVNALAYAAGQHVVFGPGRYAPGTEEGARLLAHELAHTVQQGEAPAAVQRALKFEFQTSNRVWAVKSAGAPDPRLLPRQYAPDTVGYAPGAGQESGDKPAYLSVGSKGGPALAKGAAVFVEVEGPLVMKEARSGVDPAKDAQVVRQYRFKTQVKVDAIVGKPVAAGQLVLVSEKNHAADPAMAGRFNPNTFEFRYLNADGTPLDVHLDEDRTFKRGRVKLMRTGRGDRPGIDKSKPAQHVETWKVTPDSAGTQELGGTKVRVEKVSAVNHALSASMKGAYNPDTWEKKYFMAADFTGDKLSSTATPLDVHVDEDGRLRPGRVKLMEKKTLPEAKEQTAVELQSETGGVLEFETPKWFRDWSELEERIKEAVDMTAAFNAQVGTSHEVTDPTILDAIKAVQGASAPMGKVVEWPASLSTAHLKNLRADKRRLLVQILDSAWRANIQASEGIALSEYGSLMKEHEDASVTSVVEPAAANVFNAAFAKAKARDPTLDESRFADLKGFLQLVMSYIVRGQVVDLTGEVAKAGFALMARTSFGSMYQNLLTREEQDLFKAMLGDPLKTGDNPILTELQGPVSTMRGSPVTLTRTTRFFFKKAGTDPAKATFGPTVYNWLLKMTQGSDLLSGPGISAAMGARQVQTQPDTKDYKHAQFEVRGTTAHGGSVQPASAWVSFAKNIFDSAKTRSLDTPDDPSTPKVNETSRTGLKD
jgi:hypothetical protein